MRASTCICLATALVACSGVPTVDGDIATVSARIDGTQWYARSVGATNPATGHFEITGLGFGPGDYSITLVLDHVSGPGTYALGVAPSVIGGNGYLSQSASTWSTTWRGDEGEVTITTLTATRIAGTFRFDADPNLATSPRIVTQGAFDVGMPSGAGPGGPNQGHWMEGTVNGPFIAAAATVLSYPGLGTPTLSISGGDGVTTIGINVQTVTAPGTFALSTISPVRSITVSGISSGVPVQWTSATAGGGGSVTVTSLTPDRIQGSFTATLIAYLGSVIPPPLVVSGTFDMGRGT